MVKGYPVPDGFMGWLKDEDIANGEDLENVRYWTSEIRKELGLNEPII